MENQNIIPVAMVLSAFIIAGGIYFSGGSVVKTLTNENSPSATQQETSELQQAVLPLEGVVLPITWGDLGQQLVKAGAIDAEKFMAIYEKRGDFSPEDKALLLGQNNDQLKITSDNAGFLLNLFWALGLANKNAILETGEMTDSRYNGAGNFASTGGWTIAVGNPMTHYSQHEFLVLTAEQQTMVEEMSRGIYRPCCGNSTHFPDCNHGMAMLGLLELMASQGVSEADIWKTALAVNSYWFPDTYLTIAMYMQNKNVAWAEVEPKEMLGANYSSGQGYAKITAQVTKPQQQGGGGCAV